ncbi:MAG TPA: DUF2946 domain-containing protein [Trinickia sp.]|jgi:hypothetical protein|uniref:DUF2946 domain-containing protein n=1 Tax=Trinickia sp. TaxID=2571163 RepID=UPI002D0F88C5|nr:DUF2946 domain-containing protein [Trinickia sp.]HTI18875.1 DUF2946 domain-containing protein [Trinickia sp.]
MTNRSRNRLTAWLGLVAMWLIVLAPLVSQLVVSSRLQNPADAQLCSAVMSMSGDMSHDVSHSHADMLAACGYCDLLADHVAIPAMPPVLLPFVLLLTLVVATVRSTRYTPFGAFPSGRPRAPPVLRPSSL